VTSPARTVIDCARALPFDEALSVADSALRSGVVTHEELRAAAVASPRTGRTAVDRVIAAADARAANPFESVLRAIAQSVPELRVEPQVQIGDSRVDLADVRLRLVVEADSWEFHGAKDGFQKDVRRYTALVRADWTVVRFLWDDVMNRPDYVREVLEDVVQLCQREGTSRRRHAS
jgi:very-short-patch-repair endonuclease